MKPIACDATYSALAHAYHVCEDCGHQVHEHKNISWEGVYPHKLDMLGQIAIDFGIDYVQQHNRFIDEWDAALGKTRG